MNFGDEVFDKKFAQSIHKYLEEWLKAPDQKRVGAPRAELDGPIARQEVQLAIKGLRRGKACGFDVNF